MPNVIFVLCDSSFGAIGPFADREEALRFLARHGFTEHPEKGWQGQNGFRAFPIGLTNPCQKFGVA